MGNEATVENLTATTEQSAPVTEGNMSQEAYAAQEAKKFMAKIAASKIPPTAAADAPAQIEAEEPAEAAPDAEIAVEGKESDGDEQPKDTPETEETEVLSKLDPATQKAIQAMQKRIDKITARAKTAEEQLAAKANEPAPVATEFTEDPANKTSTANSDDELAKVERDARNTIEFIEAHQRLITRAIAKDEATVVIGGREFNVDELQGYGLDAKRHLDRHIPQRRQFLQARSTAVSEAKAIHAAMFDKDTAEYQEWASFQRSNPGIRLLPNAELLYAQAAIGRKALEAAKKKPEVKKASAVPPKSGADTGTAAASAKPRQGGQSSEKARLNVDLGQAMKAFTATPSQANHARVLFLQDRLKKI